jgi:hypothetical protein
MLLEPLAQLFMRTVQCPGPRIVFKMREDIKKDIEQLTYVKWIGLYQPAYKILDKDLFSIHRSVRISIFCFENSMESVRQSLLRFRLPDIIVHDGLNKIEVFISASLILTL